MKLEIKMAPGSTPDPGVALGYQCHVYLDGLFLKDLTGLDLRVRVDEIVTATLHLQPSTVSVDAGVLLLLQAEAERKALHG